ncbi:MAG: hypothetical protein IPK46_22180 [Saprospiraceae bacterium]|nr:hypothetical protein [Saprospiraceae bacterium]
MGTFWGKASLVFWILVYLVLVLLSLDHIFFWDTVQLASKQAHHFYEGSMFDFLLPDDIDSGHLPFMGWMLAWAWKILGKTLWISPGYGTLAVIIDLSASSFFTKSGFHILVTHLGKFVVT